MPHASLIKNYKCARVYEDESGGILDGDLRIRLFSKYYPSYGRQTNTLKAFRHSRRYRSSVRVGRLRPAHRFNEVANRPEDQCVAEGIAQLMTTHSNEIANKTFELLQIQGTFADLVEVFISILECPGSERWNASFRRRRETLMGR